MKKYLYLQAEQIKIERKLNNSGHIMYIYWLVKYVINGHQQKMLDPNYKITFYKILYASTLILLWFIGLFLMVRQMQEINKASTLEINKLKKEMIQQQVMFCESYARYGIFESAEECLKTEYLSNNIKI